MSEMIKKSVLAIRTMGDPCLREVSQPLQSVGSSERILIQAMFTSMYHADGVGLAAPQVGINKRIIVLDAGQGPIAMINPQIVRREGTALMEEGCLSVPGGCVTIERSDVISVQFLDAQGNPQEIRCSGLLSRAVQHECDHLDGKLIADYAEGRDREKIEQLFPEVQF